MPIMQSSQDNDWAYMYSKVRGTCMGHKQSDLLLMKPTWINTDIRQTAIHAHTIRH